MRRRPKYRDAVINTVLVLLPKMRILPFVPPYAPVVVDVLAVPAKGLGQGFLVLHQCHLELGADAALSLPRLPRFKTGMPRTTDWFSAFIPQSSLFFFRLSIRARDFSNLFSVPPRSKFRPEAVFYIDPWKVDAEEEGIEVQNFLQ